MFSVLKHLGKIAAEGLACFALYSFAGKDLREGVKYSCIMPSFNKPKNESKLCSIVSYC